MNQICLFASGNGSNAEQIMEHFYGHEQVEVSLLVSNKADAPVVEKAKLRGIEVAIFPNSAFASGNEVLDYLQNKGISWLVLAGFLRKIPSSIIQAFEGKIFNVHPSLLPKFGGKGMYGKYVHEAVYKAEETVSGITIHLVDEVYDNGTVVAQYRTALDKNDLPGAIEKKVRQLELQHYAEEIEKHISKHSS